MYEDAGKHAFRNDYELFRFFPPRRLYQGGS